MPTASPKRPLLDFPPIVKPRQWGMAPRMRNYELARRTFSWDLARRDLDGLPAGRGLNIAHEAVDRHAVDSFRDKAALRWLSNDGRVEEFSYGKLAELTSRFANVLQRFDVTKGDRVFTLLGRVPELYVAALGTLKHRAIYSPLFSALPPEPIRARLALGEARVLVTTPTLYQRKVASLRQALPKLQLVLLVGDDASVPDAFDLRRLLNEADPTYTIGPTNPEDVALLDFTSGAPGTPKGTIHVHDAVVAHHATGKLALDLHPDDVFWCTADPGWETGASYGIIALLTNGVTMVVDEAQFAAGRWYRTLQDQKVTVWCTAPAAIRMLMKAGPELPRRFDLSSLRFAASVGEPLNPEAVVWSQEVLGRPFHDNWWQTEAGGIMIANYACMDIRPGSMGKPLPGVEAAILRRTDGAEQFADVDEEGELVLRPGWPSMFRGYWNDFKRYRACFTDGFYLTGVLARRDKDGYFWFVGRKDDVVKFRPSDRLV